MTPPKEEMLTRPAPTAWWSGVWRRLSYLTLLKAAGTTAFMWLFFWAYFSLLEHPQSRPFVMPRIWLDDWIGFRPWAYPIYLSLWVYVSLVPALIGNFRALAWFGVWVSALCLVCLGMFWLWPTQTPPSGVDWSLYPGMALIKGVDAAGNACPSLHVASAVFSACWMQRILRQLESPAWTNALNWVQCGAIVWSTIATLQHVALDAAAGIAMGLLFAVPSLAHIRQTGPLPHRSADR
ncbi:MAG: phosphatase PAP2 family protein [Hydrogenophaga sp.]|nr:phosphatase PAP2 family protein [Hydrogenophaga sp.]